MPPVHCRGHSPEKGPSLVEYSAVALLEFLIMFEQGTLHFHFALDTDYVAGPSCARYSTELLHLGRLS